MDTYKNLRYANSSEGIHAELSDGSLLYVDEHSNKELHKIMLSGAYGNIAEWVDLGVSEPSTDPEFLRTQMPQLSMVDFRRKLRGIKVIQRLDEDGNPDAELDGIYEADILEKIDLIADKELAAEARDYFLYAQYIERINPWVEILGSMFDITPEEIDTFWMA